MATTSRPKKSAYETLGFKLEWLRRLDVDVPEAAVMLELATSQLTTDPIEAQTTALEGIRILQKVQRERIEEELAETRRLLAQRGSRSVKEMLDQIEELLAMTPPHLLDAHKLVRQARNLINEAPPLQTIVQRSAGRMPSIPDHMREQWDETRALFRRLYATCSGQADYKTAGSMLLTANAMWFSNEPIDGVMALVYDAAARLRQIERSTPQPSAEPEPPAIPQAVAQSTPDPQALEGSREEVAETTRRGGWERPAPVDRRSKSQRRRDERQRELAEQHA